jgi:hypothetical protein
MDDYKEAKIHLETAKTNFSKVQSGICYACDRPFPIEKVESLKQEFTLKETLHNQTLEIYQKTLSQQNILNNEYNNLLKKYNDFESLKLRLLDASHLNWTEEAYLVYKQDLEIKVNDLTKFIENIRRCRVIQDKYNSYASIEGDIRGYERSLEDFKKSDQTYTNYVMSLTSIGTLVQQYEMLTVDQVEEIDELLVGAEIRKLTVDKEEASSKLSVLIRDYEYFKDYSKQLEVILLNEKEIDVLEKNEQIYSALTYTFGSKGLVVSKLEIICRYLTEKVNYYISRVLKEDIQLKFVMDEDSLDLIITVNGKERGVANLSGSENGKVGLACMMGLRSLLPEEYQTNILILDELEANWNDRVRIELVDMLEFLLTSTNLDSIFMVANNTLLQELQIWNTRICCTKKDSISTIQIF